MNKIPFLALLSVLCIYALAAPSGRALRFFDDFELDAVGTQPAQWDVQDETPGVTDAIVGVAGPDANGVDLGKSVGFTDMTGSTGVQIVRFLTQTYTGRFAYEWSERHDAFDDYLRFVPHAALSVVVSNGTVTLPALGGQSVFNWSPNTWYRFRVEVDVPNQSFDLLVDGTLVSDDVPFATSAMSFSSANFETGGAVSSAGVRWFDEFAEYDLDAPAPTLESLGDAGLWIGLKNSDDVGASFDLMAAVLVNDEVVGSGELLEVWGGSSGFNNAHPREIPLVLSEPVALNPGDVVSIRVFARISAGSRHKNGTARLWYNDPDASSRFSITIDRVSHDLFLLDGFLLGDSPGPGPKLKADVSVNRNKNENAYKLFGEWSFMFE